MNDPDDRPLAISLVVAMTRAQVIGKDGGLPWHLPRDLKRFREVTWGKPIVMGRKTYESLGRPLPGRLNIVLTRDPAYSAPGCTIVRTPEDTRAAARREGATELMIIGGRQIYEAFLPLCQTAHVTLVEGDFPGDTVFPVDLLNSPDWEILREEHWPADPRNPLDATYFLLSRRGLASA